MQIIVPIKQVPETKSVKMDEKTGTVIREGVESIINPLDLYAIEAALRIKEEHGGTVIAICMGPMKALEALKEAIAMGVDEAILLSDKTFAGSDTWATSLVLATAIKKIGNFPIIICGERATDGDTGQVGPGIASFLDIPVATYVSKISNISENSCNVVRIIENGFETLKCAVPLVITVVKEIAVPRLPTLAGKKKAKKANIPIWDAKLLNLSPEDIGLKGSPTRVIKIFQPKLARNCEKIICGDEEKNLFAANSFLSFMQKKELI